jgi:hypothetical protein
VIANQELDSIKICAFDRERKRERKWKERKTDTDREGG